MTRPRSCRSWWRRPVLAAVCLALAGPALAACGDPAGPVRVEAADDGFPGTAVVITEPTGTITVTVGRPVTELASSATGDRESYSAPAGSSYVPVRWSFDPGGQPWAPLLALQPQVARLAVTVSDQRFEVGEPYTVVDGRGVADRFPRAFFVRVPGRPDPAEIGVVVDYDGATQVGDLGSGQVTGPGSDLAALGTAQPRTGGCPDWRGGSGETLDATCDWTWSRSTPYWPGLGWAPDGRRWRVVSLGLLAAHGFTTGSATYDATEVTVTLGPGAGQGEGLGDTIRGEGTSAAGFLVLAEPSAGPPVEELTVRVTGLRRSGSGAEGTTVRFTGLIPPG